MSNVLLNAEDVKFFNLLLEAVEETYREYQVLKCDIEGLTNYEEPDFESAIEKAKKLLRKTVDE